MNHKTAPASLLSSLIATIGVVSLVTSAGPALAETLAPGAPVPESTDNVVVDGAGPLKKAGATTLSVFFEKPADEGNAKTAWLIGAKAGKIVWIKPLPLKLEVNRAKADVLCRKGQIVILSQFSGSAAYTSQTFNWDGKVAALVATKQGDPSQEVVDTLTRLAEKGTRASLDQFDSADHNLAYPGNYVTQANVLVLLSRGHKAAQALAAKGQPALAAQRLELTFDASQDLVERAAGAGEQTKIPAKWIDAWNADCLQLPEAKWAPLLKDYAQYLQKCGKQKQATNILSVLATRAVKGDETAQSADDGHKTSQH